MIGPRIRVSSLAESLHRDSLFLDCHSHFLINGTLWNRRFDRPSRKPWVWNPVRNAMDLHSAAQGGLNAIGFTAYVPGRPWVKNSGDLMDRILDRYEQILGECKGALSHCNSPEEVRQARNDGRMASFLTIEGGHVLENRLENLARFYRRGVRLMTLTHFISNGIADGTTSPIRIHKGLSSFGKEVIREMESLGMMVDVAHCTDQALEQVLETAGKPVIFSHAGVRHYRGIERNISDDGIREITRKGGLIGLIFYPGYIGRAGFGMRGVARNARYIADRSSAQHLCIGSDVDAFTTLPAGIVTAADYPQLTQALLDEGFDQDEVRGILGENFLRFWEANVR